MRMPAPHRRGQEGLSIIELLFVVAMTGVVLTAITRFIFSTRINLMKQEVHLELNTRIQRVASNLRSGLNGSQVLLADYGGSPDFSAFRTWALATISATAGAPQPASFSQEPIVHNARVITLNQTATAGAQWGDELLYVSAIPPITVSISFTTGTYVPMYNVSVKRYQFVYYYLTLMDYGRSGLAKVPRLVEWRSQPLIDYRSIKDFSNTGAAPRLSKTCQVLSSMGYTWALDVSNLADPAASFYKIQPTISPVLAVSATMPAGLSSWWGYMDEYDFTGDYDPKPAVYKGRVSRTSGGATSGPAGFCFAYNTDQPSSSPQLKVLQIVGPSGSLNVPAHSQPDRNGQAGFPGGFEVAVVGHSTAREVHLRYVMMGLAATELHAPAKTFRGQEGYVTLSVGNDY